MTMLISNLFHNFRLSNNLIIVTFVLVVVGLGFGYLALGSKSDKKVTSRVWMEYAQDIVREKKPSPPASARFYAYVSSVYYETLSATDSEVQASLSTAEIVYFFYPELNASTTNLLLSLDVLDKEMESEGASIVAKYQARHAQDLKQLKTPLRLQKEENWIGESPLEPTAGTWQRWALGSATFEIPAPPVFKSKEYFSALAVVKDAADNRTSEQGAVINFWGGVPGTEAPAGIWQNRLYLVTRELYLSDKEYSYAQMILAQAIADAFMECWRVKYVFWTKRPSMADPTINLAMENPPFPSYVSGHSTISRAAAEVLVVLFPRYKDTWLNDAEEAKNSRLWAGIHFPYDNEIGADFGEKISETFIRNIGLQKIK